ncbi:fluoride efflux transporter FluC [Nocardioides abyssi]|uniref:Fluoride-specific ion channel FluC n=1 Tax=Nocardioides abyssi TaxID=3058370 RepID=A0ABT8EYW7_9ACTN|nr:CrcB family protein [Nocardioides abyssi]MDN4163370.1 CrcB family protein [Nocardioides abyssi]
MSPRLLAAVAAGGAVGAALRWACGEAVPDGPGLPATTLAVNVVGSLLLALLPAIAVVRRSATLRAAVGPGLLGGFTTLSAASEQTRSLLADGRPALALGYLLGTLLATVAAVALATRLAPQPTDAGVAS